MAVEFNVKNQRTSEYRFLPEDITINPALNGRFDKPDIEWLITDILAHGQHTAVVIRNDGGNATLVAGFSRWRAISEINRRHLAPVPMKVRCTYVQCTEAEAFLLNISENRFRNPTTPIDDAHNIKRLLNVYAFTEEDVAALYFPTAATDEELKAAARFVKDRIQLISLTPEAEEAVISGRVKDTAATAIAKLSENQQREVLKTEGTIDRKAIRAVKAAPNPIKKKLPKEGFRHDPELLRRVTAVLEDVSGLLDDQELQYLEVERLLLINLQEYINEINKLKAA